MKRAFLFPGQGSQFVGMGKDIDEAFPEAKQTMDRICELAQKDIRKICFEEPEETLNQTENTQIAILATSLSILSVLEKRGIKADVCAGLSLGEYTALVYAGVLSLEEAVPLILKRGYYMGNLLPQGEFAMAAVMGTPAEIIEEICDQVRKAGKFVVPANYNYSGQIVISGEKEGMEQAREKLKLAGVKRIIPLKTSGPFHTVMLEQAKHAYQKELEQIHFNPCQVKVIKNIDGNYYQANDNMVDILASHIVSPVRFDRALKLMANLPIDQYVEIGPGKTLSTFVSKENKENKENKEIQTFTIQDKSSLEEFLTFTKIRKEEYVSDKS